MSKRSMMQLRDMLCKELDEIAMKGDIKAGDLQSIHTLTDTIKSLDKIEMLEGGESHSMGPYPGGSSYGYGEPYRPSYDSGYGYGDDYPRRGSHYSSADRHYSMDDAKSRLMTQIETMMRDANEVDRQALTRAMDALRR